MFVVTYLRIPLVGILSYSYVATNKIPYSAKVYEEYFWKTILIFVNDLSLLTVSISVFPMKPAINSSKFYPSKLMIHSIHLSKFS